jgi:hypothetical protein
MNIDKYRALLKPVVRRAAALADQKRNKKLFVH